MSLEKSGNHSVPVANSRSSSEDDVIIVDVDDSDDLFPDVVVTKKPPTKDTNNKGAKPTPSTVPSKVTATSKSSGGTPRSSVVKQISSDSSKPAAQTKQGLLKKALGQEPTSISQHKKMTPGKKISANVTKQGENTMDTPKTISKKSEQLSSQVSSSSTLLSGEKVHKQDHEHSNKSISSKNPALSNKVRHKKKRSPLGSKPMLSKTSTTAVVKSGARHNPSSSKKKKTAAAVTPISSQAAATTTLGPKSSSVMQKSPQHMALQSKSKSLQKSPLPIKSVSVPQKSSPTPCLSPTIITLQHFALTAAASNSVIAAEGSPLDFTDDDLFEVLDSVESDGICSAYNQSDSDSTGDPRPSTIDPKQAKLPTCRLPSESRLCDFTKSFSRKKSQRRQVARKSTALNGARVYKHPIRGRGRICMKNRYCTLVLKKLPRPTVQKAKEDGEKYHQFRVIPSKKKLTDPSAPTSQAKRLKLSSDSAGNEVPALLSPVQINPQKKEKAPQTTNETTKHNAAKSVKKKPITPKPATDKNMPEKREMNSGANSPQKIQPQPPTPKTRSPLPLILKKSKDTNLKSCTPLNVMVTVLQHDNDTNNTSSNEIIPASINKNPPSEVNHNERVTPDSTIQMRESSETAALLKKSLPLKGRPNKCLSLSKLRSQNEPFNSEQPFSDQHESDTQTPAVKCTSQLSPGVRVEDKPLSALPTMSDKNCTLAQPSSSTAESPAVPVPETLPPTESASQSPLEVNIEAIEGALTQTDEVLTPASDNSSSAAKLSLKDETYDLRLMETIAKLVPTPVAQERSRNHSTTSCAEDQDDHACELGKLSLVVKFPISKLSRVPASSEAVVLTQPAGLFRDASIQAERGMIIDKDVLDNYLTVKLHEAMLSMKEQLQLMEAQVSNIAKQKESLERTLRAKSQYIKDMTITGFRPELMDKETMTDPYPLSPGEISQKPKSRKSKKGQEVGTQTRPKTATVSSQTDGFVRHVPSRLKERSQAVCLYRHPESELQLYIEDGRRNADLVGECNSGKYNVASRERWLTSPISAGECSRSVAVSLKSRFLKAVLPSAKFQNIDAVTASMQVIAGDETGDKDGTPGILITHECIPHLLHAPLLKLNKLYYKLKSLPKEPVQERHMSSLLQSVHHLFSHLPVEVKSTPLSPNRDALPQAERLLASPKTPPSSKAARASSTPPSAEQSSSSPPSTPGAASWVMGAKMQALVDALQDLYDKGEAVFPNYFKAELAQLQKKTKETLAFLTKGLRHETFAHDKSGCIVNSDVQPRPWRNRDLKINPFFHRLFLDIGIRGVVQELNRLEKQNRKGRRLGKESSEDDSDLEMLFSSSPPVAKRRAKAASAASVTQKGKSSSQQRKASVSKQQLIRQVVSRVHKKKKIAIPDPPTSNSPSMEASGVRESSDTSSVFLTEAPIPTYSVAASKDSTVTISSSDSGALRRKSSETSTRQTINVSTSTVAAPPSSTAAAELTIVKVPTSVPASSSLSTATVPSSVPASSSSSTGAASSSVTASSSPSTIIAPSLATSETPSNSSAASCCSSFSTLTTAVSTQSCSNDTQPRVSKSTQQPRKCKKQERHSSSSSSNPCLIENSNSDNITINSISQGYLLRAMRTLQVFLQTVEFSLSDRELYNRGLTNVAMLVHSKSTADLKMAQLLITQMTQKLQGRPWPVIGNTSNVFAQQVRPVTASSQAQLRPTQSPVMGILPQQAVVSRPGGSPVMGHPPVYNSAFARTPYPDHLPANRTVHAVRGNSAHALRFSPSVLTASPVMSSATVTSVSPVMQSQSSATTLSTVSSPIISTPVVSVSPVYAEQSMNTTQPSQRMDTQLTAPASTVPAVSTASAVASTTAISTVQVQVSSTEPSSSLNTTRPSQKMDTQPTAPASTVPAVASTTAISTVQVQVSSTEPSSSLNTTRPSQKMDIQLTAPASTVPAVSTVSAVASTTAISTVQVQVSSTEPSSSLNTTRPSQKMDTQLTALASTVPAVSTASAVASTTAISTVQVQVSSAEHSSSLKIKPTALTPRSTTTSTAPACGDVTVSADEQNEADMAAKDTTSSEVASTKVDGTRKSSSTTNTAYTVRDAMETLMLWKDTKDIPTSPVTTSASTSSQANAKTCNKTSSPALTSQSSVPVSESGKGRSSVAQSTGSSCSALETNVTGSTAPHSAAFKPLSAQATTSVTTTVNPPSTLALSVTSSSSCTVAASNTISKAGITTSSIVEVLKELTTRPPLHAQRSSGNSSSRVLSTCSMENRTSVVSCTSTMTSTEDMWCKAGTFSRSVTESPPSALAVTAPTSHLSETSTSTSSTGKQDPNYGSATPTSCQGLLASTESRGSTGTSAAQPPASTGSSVDTETLSEVSPSNTMTPGLITTSTYTEGVAESVVSEPELLPVSASAEKESSDPDKVMKQATAPAESQTSNKSPLSPVSSMIAAVSASSDGTIAPQSDSNQEPESILPVSKSSTSDAAVSSASRTPIAVSQAPVLLATSQQNRPPVLAQSLNPLNLTTNKSTQHTPGTSVNNIPAVALAPTQSAISVGQQNSRTIILNQPTTAAPPQTTPISTSMLTPIPRTEANVSSLSVPPPIVHIPTLSSLYQPPPPPPKQETPPEVSVQVTKIGTGLVIKWTFAPEFLSWQGKVKCYELFAFVCNSTTTVPSVSLWGKVGEIRPLPLPMAVTLTNFAGGQRYAFSVRVQYAGGVTSNYSNPCSIFL